MPDKGEILLLNNLYKEYGKSKTIKVNQPQEKRPKNKWNIRYHIPERGKQEELNSTKKERNQVLTEI